MTAPQRDSFETLDLDDVEMVGDDPESGLRALPSEPRGLWSDKPPAPTRMRSEVVPKMPPPAPTPRMDAPPADAGPEAEPVWERESERISLDGLVADLSTRRPPPATVEEWELPVAAGPSAQVAPRRATSPWLLAGVGLVAYALGIATPYLLGWLAVTDTGPASAAAATPTETPERVEAPAQGPQGGVEPVVIRASADELAAAPAPEQLGASQDEPVTGAAQTRDAVAPRAPSARPEPAASRASAAQPERTQRSAPPVEERAVEPVATAGSTSDTDVAPAEDLPATPARSDVEAAMASVRSDVQACGDASTSGFVAQVRFTFGQSGRVTHAVAQGVSGPAASCIARAARGAQLAPFAQDRFVVQYPFTL